MFSLVSCRSDTFRRREPRSTNNQIMPQLLDATCTQENHQKTKEIPRVPRHNFLYSCSSCLQSCEFKALMAGVCALLDKDPSPILVLSPFPVDSSGIQRVMGPVSICAKSHFRLPGNGNGRRGWTPEQRDWLQRETFNVHHSSSLAARPTTQHL